MRVTPRRVLWVVVLCAFVFVVKDDVINFVQYETNEVSSAYAKDVRELGGAAADAPGAAPAPAAPAAPTEPPVPKTPEELEIEDWENLQAGRREIVRQVCHEVREHADVDRPPGNELFKHMLVDHEHHVLLCPFRDPVPTDNFKQGLSWVARSALRVDENGNSYLGDVVKPPAAAAPAGGNATVANATAPKNYTEEETDYILNNYLKVMFPDHPYERLTAIFDQQYRNRSNEIGVTLGRTIVRMSRPGAPWKEVTDSEIYFHEFIQFVLKKKSSIEDFMIYFDMCHVCDIPWDYIGKTDTFSRDFSHINAAAHGEPLNNTVLEAEVKAWKDEEVTSHLKERYSNVTEYEMLRIYDDFSLDMYLFNFSWPFWKLTLIDHDPTKDGIYA